MTIETRPIEVPAREKTVADVLRHAALVIEERGWSHGQLRSDDGSVCVWGGIRTAVFGDDEGNGFMEDKPAIRVLAESLGFPTTLHHGLGHVVEWNDAPGRIAEQVTAALRAAADAWETADV